MIGERITNSHDIPNERIEFPVRLYSGQYLMYLELSSELLSLGANYAMVKT